MTIPSHHHQLLDAASASRESEAVMPAVVTSDRVIVFSRFPEPGKVKTRLIPALGPDGAGQVHAMLTRITFEIARRFCGGSSCDLEVCFADGDVCRMQSLFGHDLHYSEQEGNGLGERLEHAISAAFKKGSGRVVVIGTDCPEMEPSILQAAFDSLLHDDVVLGPAIDGGYYLIGLRANRQELFRGIDWSTENVLRQTLEIAQRLGYSVRQLKPLSDVDNPEDLITCRRTIEAFTDVLPEGLARWYSSISRWTIE